MLQNIRDNSKGLVAKIIVGFIVMTFALWGVDSLIGMAGGSNAPATVNGVEISERQLLDGVEFQRRQILNRMGENADPSLLDENQLRRGVLQDLIQQELLLQSGQDQGLYISDAHIDQLILTTPDFQNNGQFDRDLFEGALRNVGLTPMTYRDLLRRDMLIQQERSALVATSFSLPGEVGHLARLDGQQRDIRYIKFEAGSLAAGIDIDEPAIEAYFSANASRYMREEQVAIEYVELNKLKLAETIELDEEELLTQYNQLVTEYVDDEARRAAHILVAVNDEQPDKSALAKIEALAESLQQGADFTAVARQHSQDTGSAENGGDLGYIEKGVMVPEFEEALYALNKGELSGPVKTEFGYHLIKLLDVDAGSVPSFEEVRAQLEAEQRRQKAEAAFVAQSEELVDLSFSSSNLQEVVAVMGLEASNTALFSRSGAVEGENKHEDLTSNPRVLAAAFSDEVLENGNNSDLIELDSHRVLVLRVKQHEQPRPVALEEVREEIVAALRFKDAAEQVKAQADALISGLSEQGLSAAETLGYDWTLREGLERGGLELDPSITTKAFKLPRPGESGFTAGQLELADGSAVVIVLDLVIDKPHTDLTDEQKRGIGGFVANRFGQADYYELIQALQSRADIERR
jgi:peptidyl-prolyl cis-trans isomerase D